MSKTEWHYLLFGTFGAAINGSFPFIFAFLLGEIFGVSAWYLYFNSYTVLLNTVPQGVYVKNWNYAPVNKTIKSVAYRNFKSIVI